MARKRRFCEVGTEVQTLIFPKERFTTAKAAKAWARDHGFAYGKVDAKTETFRLRQHPPDSFIRRTFRTIEFGDSGIKAVVGCPSPDIRLTKFEESLVETKKTRKKVAKELRPLFDHITNLALHSHKSGYPMRAGRELRQARNLAKIR